MSDLQTGVETCQNCGRKVQFAVNQFSKFCPSCGVYITIRPMQVLTGDKTRKPPRCFVCMDKGYLLFSRQRLGFIYDVIARCECEAGQTRFETGWPLVTEVKNVPDLKFIAYRNKQSWEKANKKKGA